MIDLMTSLKTILDPFLVTEGIVDRIYWGVFGEARQTLRSDTSFLLVDDDGEAIIGSGRPIQMHIKEYRVYFEMAVRAIDNEDAMLDLLTRWRQFESILYLPENRQIVGTDYMISEEIETFPPVEVAMMYDGDVPAWRLRRMTVPYRRPICHGGYK